MQEASATPRFEPAHDAHAVEQVVFAVQLTKPLDKAQHAAACKVITDQFKDDLPGTAELQALALRINIGVGGDAGGSARPDGRAFRRGRTDGSIESELRLQRATISYTTTAYTRWQSVWEQASKYFSVVLPIYLSASKIASVTLNYVDKFVWQGDPQLCRADRLLRLGSKYVCPHVFDTPDLWHSHTGAFLPVENHTKRLINVNLDCLEVTAPDESVQRTVTISTLFTDNLLPPEYDTLGITAGSAHDFVGARMRELHAASKKLFGDIVSDAICARIALTD